MATLTVTFTRAFPNVYTTQVGAIAVGDAARSEVITLPDTSSLETVGGENAVELTASDDCWVAIGADPDPADNTAGIRSAHFLKAGVPYQYHVSEGDKVAAEV
ncbi:hypothetical protein [Sinorhizobium americanum]|uniref:Uncharacterized protein n=1 Tax=Sinorhizobium americanum TaxID=194963 RepID=A0A4R2BWC1_9HYPH|nr:hypothetical protein [Sinorhizobium americanum]TCN30354.1 hypothetical protein EV184_108228 [Sinorhizobium americanum]